MLEHVHRYAVVAIVVSATITLTVIELTHLKEHVFKLLGKGQRNGPPSDDKCGIEIRKGLFSSGERISLDDESTISIRKEVTEIRISRSPKGKS